MPEIGLRKTFLKVVYDHLLNTDANLFLKLVFLSLLTQLKSSKLNPVYPNVWSSVLVAITLESGLSLAGLNIFPVSMCEYIRRRIAVMVLSWWFRVPEAWNFFIQTWYNQDREFTWRRSLLTLLKKRSISSRFCPDWFSLILLWMPTGSNGRNGSNIWSGGKGLVLKMNLSWPWLIFYKIKMDKVCGWEWEIQEVHEQHFIKIFLQQKMRWN